jgi:hypothetical protein
MIRSWVPHSASYTIGYPCYLILMTGAPAHKHHPKHSPFLLSNTNYLVLDCIQPSAPNDAYTVQSVASHCRLTSPTGEWLFKDSQYGLLCLACIKTTRPVLDIFKMDEYFLDRPRTALQRAGLCSGIMCY